MTDYGAWNPGIVSQVPAELRHLCTLFRSENAFTSIAAAHELRQLTGLPLCDLVIFRPQRLVLHELMIRVMADFLVPTGETIGDLGINFRTMTNRLLQGYIEPEMPAIVAEYESVRRRLSEEVGAALSVLIGSLAPRFKVVRRSSITKLFHRARRPSHAVSATSWGPEQIAECERISVESVDVVQRAACRALARVMSSLF